MIWKLALLFTVVPAIELYLLIQIGQAIGPLETVLIIVLTGVLGGWLAKREGLAVVRQLGEDLRKGIPPATRLVEGVLVLVGGVLLITPGVLTDVTGILLLLPTRKLVAPLILRWLTARFAIEGVKIGPDALDPRMAAEPLRTPASERQGTPFDHPVR
jgi:UPF0716 protein FxsA